MGGLGGWSFLMPGWSGTAVFEFPTTSLERAAAAVMIAVTRGAPRRSSGPRSSRRGDRSPDL